MRLRGLGDPQSRPPACGSPTCSSVNLLSKHLRCGTFTVCILFGCTLECRATRLCSAWRCCILARRLWVGCTICFVLPQCASFCLGMPPSFRSLKTHLINWQLYLVCEFQCRWLPLCVALPKNKVQPRYRPEASGLLVCSPLHSC